MLDNEDYELALSHNTKWHIADSGVYARSKLKLSSMGRREKIALHRLVLNYFEVNLNDVDHIDRNRLNNQKSNLRIIPHKLNIVNCEKQEGMTSKYKGVSWHKKGKKWQVHLCKDGSRHYGGLFEDEIEAARKANVLMVKLFGEFACLNQI